jgi:hypothetical protein
MSKKVAVLFSGGLDSTYLVWKNLKDGNEVTPVYIEIENNKTKSTIEKNRIELLLEEYRKEFNRKINNIQYAVSVGVNANEDSLYFKQMPIWIFGMVFLQGMDVDEIQIGYVSNDDAISYLDDIQNIYKSYQPICEPMKPLVFPLIKTKKWKMADELPEQYRKLIFSCENARIIGSETAAFIEYEPCCECVPCKNIIATDYYNTRSFPEIYKKKILMQHARSLHWNGYKIIDANGKDYFEVNCSTLEPKNEPYQLEINFELMCDMECGCNKIEQKIEIEKKGI